MSASPPLAPTPAPATSARRMPASPATVVWLGGVITLLLFAFVGWNVRAMDATYRRIETDAISVQRVSGRVDYHDVEMTNAALMAAATGASTWERQYRRHEPQVYAAMERLLAHAGTFGARTAAAEVLRTADSLVAVEHETFALVRAGQRADAWERIAGARYAAHKRHYRAAIAEVRTTLRAHVDRETAAMQRRLVGVLLLLVACAVGVVIAAAAELTVVRRYLRAQRETALALRRAHDALEERVRERTADLERTVAALHAESEERLAAQARLSEAHQALRLHLDRSPLGFIQLDAERRVTDWNGAAERIFGRTRDQVIGQPVNLIVAQRDRRRVEGVLDALGDQAGGQRSTNWNVTHDGREILCEWYNTRLVDADGGLIGYAGLVQDVTEAHATAEARRASEARLRVLFEQAGDGISVHDLEGRVVEVNDAICRLLGYTREELRGMHVHDIERTIPKDELMERWRRMTPGVPVTTEGRLRRRDGHHVPAEVRLTAFLLDGRTHLISIVRDVTRRVELEARLRQSQKMEAIGRLAGGIAHDFNNLLMAIGGNAELAMRSLDAGRPAHESLEDIRRNTDRAAALTRQLLTFSRQRMPTVELVDLNALVTGTDRLLRPLVGTEVELTCLPASGVEPVRADAGQLEQVVMNLVVNARDAVRPGGRILVGTRSTELSKPTTIRRVRIPAGRYSVLTVEDDGIGMNQATQARIFEPFFTTKEVGKGSGLGLATVHGIVEQCGAHIAVDSRPGEGATFSIYFPVAAGTVVRAPGASSARREPEQRSLAPATILLVDDDAPVRRLTRRLLERWEVRVIEAVNGEEALRLFAEHRREITLVLTDVVMPLLGGRELTERLAAFAPEVPVVRMSGYTGDPDDHEPGERGLFLAKPFDGARLHVLLSQLLPVAAPAA